MYSLLLCKQHVPQGSMRDATFCPLTIGVLQPAFCLRRPDFMKMGSSIEQAFINQLAATLEALVPEAAHEDVVSACVSTLVHPWEVHATRTLQQLERNVRVVSWPCGKRSVIKVGSVGH
jgi:hypothetical protein